MFRPANIASLLSLSLSPPLSFSLYKLHQETLVSPSEELMYSGALAGGVGWGRWIFSFFSRQLTGSSHAQQARQMPPFPFCDFMFLFAASGAQRGGLENKPTQLGGA